MYQEPEGGRKRAALGGETGVIVGVNGKGVQCPESRACNVIHVDIFDQH
jgi:hypothetical protein